jgi:hypothetical protein
LRRYDKARLTYAERRDHVQGRKCFCVVHTGDGCYRDNYGDDYPVDTGMLAAVPTDLYRPGMN